MSTSGGAMKKIIAVAALALTVGLLVSASSAVADTIVCTDQFTRGILHLPITICVNDPTQGGPIVTVPPITATPPASSTPPGSTTPSAPTTAVPSLPSGSSSGTVPTPSATPSQSDKAENKLEERLTPFAVFIALLVAIWGVYVLVKYISKKRKQKKLAQL